MRLLCILMVDGVGGAKVTHTELLDLVFVVLKLVSEHLVSFDVKGDFAHCTVQILRVLTTFERLHIVLLLYFTLNGLILLIVECGVLVKRLMIGSRVI